MKNFISLLVIGILAFIGSGCASIVDGGTHKTVSIITNPAGATVTVTDKKGAVIATQTTPTVVSLKRRHDYKLSIALAGYYPTQVEVNSRLNAWYLGNVLFGGLIGLVIVDPLTGAMWTLHPRHVEWNLVPHTTDLSSNELAAAELKLNPPEKAKPIPTKGTPK